MSMFFFQMKSAALTFLLGCFLIFNLGIVDVFSDPLTNIFDGIGDIFAGIARIVNCGKVPPSGAKAGIGGARAEFGGARAEFGGARAEIKAAKAEFGGVGASLAGKRKRSVK